MHLTMLSNNESGISKKKAFLRNILKQCLDEGWTFELRSSWWINEEENVGRILQQTDPIVVICGGDGTITKVMQAFWEKKALHKVRFYLLGEGTFNALSKNCPHQQRKNENIVSPIRENQIKSLDILELALEREGEKVSHMVQTGVLLVKDSQFTLHAAEIRKAMRSFDVRLGFRSLKKALPYLENIHTFQYDENQEQKRAQGIYIANNPYLITEQEIHSSIQIDDGEFNIFTAQELDYFQIGQAGSVLLLGKKRDLPFLAEQRSKEWSVNLLEDIEMNIDGDILPVKGGTKITVKVSEQRAKIFC